MKNVFNFKNTEQRTAFIQTVVAIGAILIIAGALYTDYVLHHITK